ncbi:N-terminal domain of Peptidase_S41 [Chitinophaga arvensicola]|uniref:N-terminal domain of Peptidase_S41 n=2 Tax=Chitinophaga arvensicola TaxID=29529 RepID=A0A1I0SDU0_9BACT|nr:N-terminal domain of Peptidase_S41 [Chitinophaga arvensicola]
MNDFKLESYGRYAVVIRKSSILYMILLMFIPFVTRAQQVSSKEVHAIVQKICMELENRYPFPDISKRYADMLKANEKTYQHLNADLLASRLTQDLQKVHKDVHLNIYVQQPPAEPSEAEGNQEEKETAQLQKNGYGFKSVELDNVKSVAYISIPYGFNCTQEGFEMAGHAMSMAAYSKYIIIDVRGDGGGAGGMGHFLASYFFNPGEEVLYLNGFEKDRKQEKQEYTFGYVPGRRLTNSKLFILTDRGTASACEGFAYAMQKLGKATIVGDTTAGAGIAGIGVSLERNLEMFLPVKMLVAPGTEVGWEGTGVIPDVACSSSMARSTAMQLIDKRFLADAGLKNPALKKWLMEDSAYMNSNIIPDKATEKLLVGSYEQENVQEVSIASTDTSLVLTARHDGKDYAYSLNLLSKDVYVLGKPGAKKEGPLSTRVYVHKDVNGAVDYLELKVLTPGGDIQTSGKYNKMKNK